MIKSEISSSHMSQELRHLILEWLGRKYLSQVCSALGLVVSDRRRYESYIESLDKAAVPLDMILSPLPRENLKRLCDYLTIDSSGKEKVVIINRIMDTIALVATADSGKQQPTAVSSRQNSGTKATPERREPIIAKTAKAAKAAKQQVFIVHGHDELLKLEVARFTESLHLEPIILAEQPNLGRTIIEKFEKHAGDADFAIVLLTPDDMGGTKLDAISGRARQNVILELGYFIGKLGRNRVCALYKSGVELPSDVLGVLYVSVDGDWRIRLAREMKAAGVTVDLNHVV